MSKVNTLFEWKPSEPRNYRFVRYNSFLWSDIFYMDIFKLIVGEIDQFIYKGPGGIITRYFPYKIDQNIQ